MLKVLNLRDSAEWKACLQDFALTDVFFYPEYARICYENEEGVPYLFYFQSNEGSAAQVSLVRDLSSIAVTKPEYSHFKDMVTPYGYGGPLLSVAEDRSDSRVMVQFRSSLQEYCLRENIIAEFIRFHPLLNNPAQNSSNGITSICRGKTVYMDLSLPKDEIWRSLAPSNRNKIRKSLKNGVQITSGGRQYVQDLFNLYNQRMHNLQATHNYFFDREYFLRFFEYLPDNSRIFLAQYQERVIMAALILNFGPFIHYHLSGSDWNFRNLGSNNLLLYQIALWGKELGAKYFHLGGGYRSEDSLFAFKSSFSTLRADFFVGHKVHNTAAYDSLVKKWEEYYKQKCTTSFFPAYRCAYRGEEELQQCIS